MLDASSLTHSTVSPTDTLRVAGENAMSFIVTFVPPPAGWSAGVGVLVASSSPPHAARARAAVVRSAARGREAVTMGSSRAG